MDQVIEVAVEEVKEEIVELSLTELAMIGGGAGALTFD